MARRCRDAGIAVIRRARLGDIGAAIQSWRARGRVGVVREVGGHGIGRRMHAEPHVAHIGKRGTGPRLKAGMAITVEPMVNLGGAAIRHLDDGWTIVTADGSLSAQWEHTVISPVTATRSRPRSRRWRERRGTPEPIEDDPRDAIFRLPPSVKHGTALDREASATLPSR